MSTQKIIRIDWCDYVKGLAGVLVILAHSMVPRDLFDFLTYIIAVFPFVSGYLYKSETFLAKIKKRWKLLYQYYFIGTVNTFLWILIVPSEFKKASNIEYIVNFILIRTDKFDAVPLNTIPLWFFSTIFFIEVIYSTLEKKFFLKWSIILIGFFMRYFYVGSLPFKIDVVLSSLIIFELGRLLRKKQKNINKDLLLIEKKKYSYLFLPLFLWIITYIFFGGVDWNADFFGRTPVLNFIGELSSILTLITVSYLLSKRGLESLFVFVSKNLIPIIGYHIIIGMVMYFSFLPFIKNPLGLLENLWFLYFLVTTVATILFVRFSPKSIMSFLLGNTLFSWLERLREKFI